VEKWLQQTLKPGIPMAFDFKPVFKEMVATIVRSLAIQANSDIDKVTSHLENHYTMLRLLAELHYSGDLAIDDFKREVENELAAYRSEIITRKIAERSAVQKAINEAKNVLMKAVAG
jgi:hypothetical protein